MRVIALFLSCEIYRYSKGCSLLQPFGFPAWGISGFKFSQAHAGVLKETKKKFQITTLQI